MSESVRTADPKHMKQFAKLDLWLRDLEDMKAELIPDSKKNKTKEDMKGLDKWQKSKYTLENKLKDVRASVNKLDEIKRTLREGERDKETITLINQNQKMLKECTAMWSELKQHMLVDEQKRRKKLGDEAIEERKQLTQNLGKEIVELQNRNKRVRGTDTVEDLERATAKKKTRLEQKKEERKAKRERRKKGKKSDGSPDKEPVEMSAQTQEFLDMKDQAYAEQDELLDEINEGLQELLEIAEDAGKKMQVQKAMMDDLENKIDTQNERLAASNKKLKEMLAEQNGLTRWCPMFICIIILLALLGFLFQQIQENK